MPGTEAGIWRQAIRQGLAAAGANLRPGIVIWLLALAVLLAWHASPACRAGLETLSAFKQRWNLPFAFLSTGLAGGLIPILILRWLSRDPRYDLRCMLLLTAFWAVKGVEINLFYDLQAWIFGSGGDLATLALKTAVDQLVYAACYAVPCIVLFFTWMDHGLDGVKQAWRRGWYARSVLPVMLANLGVWIPALLVIYSLETPLQLPLQNLVLCFWSLMVAVMGLKRRPQEQTADAA
jgi:hypothetical protein